eukprot:796813-Ditylum_brightwellii.AAC.1
MLAKASAISARSNALDLPFQSHANGATRNKVLHPHQAAQVCFMGFPCRRCVVCRTSFAALLMIYRSHERKSSTTNHRYHQVQAPWSESTHCHTSQKSS